MTTYINLFSPDTYETYTNSNRTISGFRKTQLAAAQKINEGDKFLCYLTKLKRWVGIQEIKSKCYIDETPIYYKDSDPFILRFKVESSVWLERDFTLPIHEDILWNNLSFTKDLPKTSAAWTGIVRGSLRMINPDDAKILEEAIRNQALKRKTFKIEKADFDKYIDHKIRRDDGLVSVTVPDDKIDDEKTKDEKDSVRESINIQAKLAHIGEKMGFSIWIPRSDRVRVNEVWHSDNNSLLNSLPLNYDEVTLKTIEQIDVIWLKRRSIVRAFEVEHTTSIYSGLLRMADLLALQPNMDIKLHIVAPSSRREKVFQEIQRPVFSLLDKGPLAELCTYISYENVEEITSLPHLESMKDILIDSYSENSE